MRSHSRWLPVLKVAAPVVVLTAAALGARALVLSRTPASRVASSAAAPVVEVLELQPEDLRVQVRTHGEARPLHDVTLVAEVAGRVLEVSDRFLEGGLFAAGEPLLRLDPEDWHLAVTRAEAAVAQAEAALALEEAQAQLSLQDWAGMEEGPPPPLAAREPQLARARADLAAAQAALAESRRNLERTVVRAPFPCRIAARLADLGQYVLPGTPLARIHDRDAAEVRLPVPDRELQWLELSDGDPGAAGEGPRVVLSAEYAGARRSWQGRVLRTAAELDPRSRMAVLVARVEDPWNDDGDRVPLPMGLFLEAAIEGSLLRGVYRLPRAALREGDRVLLVDQEDRLRNVPVGVLRRAADEVLVRGGLAPGARLCVTPLEVVVDGMAVRVREKGAEQ